MSDQPKLSICVPSRNRQDCFRQTILDLVANPRADVEFVIADTAKTNPKAKGQTPESLRVLDDSVLGEIKKSGFIEKIRG